MSRLIHFLRLIVRHFSKYIYTHKCLHYYVHSWFHFRMHLCIHYLLVHISTLISTSGLIGSFYFSLFIFYFLSLLVRKLAPLIPAIYLSFINLSVCNTSQPSVVTITPSISPCSRTFPQMDALLLLLTLWYLAFCWDSCLVYIVQTLTPCHRFLLVFLSPSFGLLLVDLCAERFGISLAPSWVIGEEEPQRSKCIYKIVL